MSTSTTTDNETRRVTRKIRRGRRHGTGTGTFKAEDDANDSDDENPSSPKIDFDSPTHDSADASDFLSTTQRLNREVLKRMQQPEVQEKIRRQTQIEDELRQQRMNRIELDGSYPGEFTMGELSSSIMSSDADQTTLSTSHECSDSGRGGGYVSDPATQQQAKRSRSRSTGASGSQHEEHVSDTTYHMDDVVDTSIVAGHALAETTQQLLADVTDRTLLDIDPDDEEALLRSPSPIRRVPSRSQESNQPTPTNQPIQSQPAAAVVEAEPMQDLSNSVESLHLGDEEAERDDQQQRTPQAAPMQPMMPETNETPVEKSSSSLEAVLQDQPEAAVAVPNVAAAAPHPDSADTNATPQQPQQPSIEPPAKPAPAVRGGSSEAEGEAAAAAVRDSDEAAAAEEEQAAETGAETTHVDDSLLIMSPIFYNAAGTPRVPLGCGALVLDDMPMRSGTVRKAVEPRRHLMADASCEQLPPAKTAQPDFDLTCSTVSGDSTATQLEVDEITRRNTEVNMRQSIVPDISMMPEKAGDDSNRVQKSRGVVKGKPVVLCKDKEIEEKPPLLTKGKGPTKVLPPEPWVKRLRPRKGKVAGSTTALQELSLTSEQQQSTLTPTPADEAADVSSPQQQTAMESPASTPRPARRSVAFRSPVHVEATAAATEMHAPPQAQDDTDRQQQQPAPAETASAIPATAAEAAADNEVFLEMEVQEEELQGEDEGTCVSLGVYGEQTDQQQQHDQASPAAASPIQPAAPVREENAADQGAPGPVSSTPQQQSKQAALGGGGLVDYPMTPAQRRQMMMIRPSAADQSAFGDDESTDMFSDADVSGFADPDAGDRQMVDAAVVAGEVEADVVDESDVVDDDEVDDTDTEAFDQSAFVLPKSRWDHDDSAASASAMDVDPHPTQATVPQAKSTPTLFADRSAAQPGRATLTSEATSVWSVASRPADDRSMSFVAKAANSADASGREHIASLQWDTLNTTTISGDLTTAAEAAAADLPCTTAQSIQHMQSPSTVPRSAEAAGDDDDEDDVVLEDYDDFDDDDEVQETRSNEELSRTRWSFGDDSCLAAASANLSQFSSASDESVYVRRPMRPSQRVVFDDPSTYRADERSPPNRHNQLPSSSNESAAGSARPLVRIRARATGRSGKPTPRHIARPKLHRPESPEDGDGPPVRRSMRTRVRALPHYLNQQPQYETTTIQGVDGELVKVRELVGVTAPAVHDPLLLKCGTADPWKAAEQSKARSRARSHFGHGQIAAKRARRQQQRQQLREAHRNGQLLQYGESDLEDPNDDDEEEKEKGTLRFKKKKKKDDNDDEDEKGKPSGKQK